MDSTVTATIVGALAAGFGGGLVPRIIAAIPPIEPEPEPAERRPEGLNPDGLNPEGLNPDGLKPESGAAEVEDPPERFPDIAASPGLAWRSAVTGLLAGAVVGYAVDWTWALVVLVPCIP